MNIRMKCPWCENIMTISKGIMFYQGKCPNNHHTNKRLCAKWIVDEIAMEYLINIVNNKL